jgi:hypothetical protein
MLIKIADALLTGAICLVILLPFLLLIIFIRKPTTYYPLLIFILFFLIYELLMVAGIPYNLLSGFHSNWTLKALSIGIALVCMLFTRYTVLQYGLSFRFKKNWWIVFLLALAYFAITAIVDSRGLRHHFQFQTIAFKALLGGLDEEIWFRGVFLLLLNELLGRPIKIGKLQFGVAILLTALLFALVHGVKVDSLHISFHWASMKKPLVQGLILAVLAEAAGNIWASAALNNFNKVFRYLLGH